MSLRWRCHYGGTSCLLSPAGCGEDHRDGEGAAKAHWEAISGFRVEQGGRGVVASSRGDGESNKMDSGAASHFALRRRWAESWDYYLGHFHGDSNSPGWFLQLRQFHPGAGCEPGVGGIHWRGNHFFGELGESHQA